MCYPDSVLYHVRLRGLTAQQAEVLVDTPGFDVLDADTDTCLVRVSFAHDVPSPPDTDALERRLRLALLALVPGAEIADVRFGVRFDQDAASPAVEALHRLRRDVNRVGSVDELAGVNAEQLAEIVAVFVREFHSLDEWLCNGGSIPREWARRHPGGDGHTMEQIADRITEEFGRQVDEEFVGKGNGVAAIAVAV